MVEDLHADLDAKHDYRRGLEDIYLSPPYEGNITDKKNGLGMIREERSRWESEHDRKLRKTHLFYSK